MTRKLIQKSFLLAILLIASSLLVPQFTLAQDLGPADPGIRTGFSGTLSEAVEAVIKGGLTIVGVVAVLFIVIGGFRYVISQGDDAAVKSAKNTILYAVIGLLIVFIAGALVSFVFDAIRGGGGAGGGGGGEERGGFF